MNHYETTAQNLLRHVRTLPSGLWGARLLRSPTNMALFYSNCADASEHVRLLIDDITFCVTTTGSKGAIRAVAIGADDTSFVMLVDLHVCSRSFPILGPEDTCSWFGVIRDDVFPAIMNRYHSYYIGGVDEVYEPRLLKYLEGKTLSLEDLALCLLWRVHDNLPKWRRGVLELKSPRNYVCLYANCGNAKGYANQLFDWVSAFSNREGDNALSDKSICACEGSTDDRAFVMLVDCNVFDGDVAIVADCFRDAIRTFIPTVSIANWEYIPPLDKLLAERTGVMQNARALEVVYG